MLTSRDKWEANLMALDAGKGQGKWKGTKQDKVLEELSKTKPKSLIESPPHRKLKPLSSNLKYAFLAPSEKLPVIISTSLNKTMEERMLRVLWEHKEAIKWSIHDIKGISPLVCTHRIHMEDEFKPKVQPQRRLNLSLKEEVKKEVIKLLDA